METKELRRALSKRAKQLEKQWKEEAEKSHRKKAMDYLTVGSIQGKIDMILEIQTMIAPIKKG